MILVSIVGDFYSSVLPLFYEFKDKVSTHVIIYDSYKNDTMAANKIINGTTAFIKKHSLNIKTYSIQMNEDSLSATNIMMRKLHEYRSQEEELYINITDGLANIGVILSLEFLPLGAKILTYDRYDNEYNRLSTSLMLTQKMQSCIPIKDHFLLKNIELEKTQDMTLANRYPNDINIFFEKYEGDKKLYASSSEANPEFKKIGTGFLYEFYIYNLLKKLNFDDLLLGASIKDHKGDDLFTLNEYDILIMKNNHLHMIECKFLKELSMTDLIYKLDSVRESLDEDSNIMIVTDFDIYNEQIGLSNKELKFSYKRSLSKKIYLRGSPRVKQKEFLEDVDRIFELKSKNIEQIIGNKKSYTSLKDIQRTVLKKEINQYLSAIFNQNSDYFVHNTLLLLINCKTYRLSTPRIKNAMQKDELKDFIKLILKSLTSRQEYVSIFDLHESYKRLTGKL